MQTDTSNTTSSEAQCNRAMLRIAKINQIQSNMIANSKSCRALRMPHRMNRHWALPLELFKHIRTLSDCVRAFSIFLFQFQSIYLYDMNIVSGPAAVRTVKFCSKVTFTILQSNNSHCPSFSFMIFPLRFAYRIRFIGQRHRRTNIQEDDTILPFDRPVATTIEKYRFILREQERGRGNVLESMNEIFP